MARHSVLDGKVVDSDSGHVSFCGQNAQTLSPMCLTEEYNWIRVRTASNYIQVQVSFEHPQSSFYTSIEVESHRCGYAGPIG